VMIVTSSPGTVMPTMVAGPTALFGRSVPLWGARSTKQTQGECSLA
jgi:hypothetical protein